MFLSSRSYFSSILVGALLTLPWTAQSLTWSLAGGNESWPDWARTAVTNSMNEAVDLYNQYGYFDKHVTANYNSGVPTAQANYDGWIDFGGSYNTRVALHEIAHTLGVGTYWGWGSLGNPLSADSAAGRLEKLFDGQTGAISRDGAHFWPYGLNYDNEDGIGARERLCKMVAALRFDMDIVGDSDNDGLPDNWERHHFGNLDQDDVADPDQDGILNIDEYGSDGDPNLACPVTDGQTYVIRGQLGQRALSIDELSSEEGALIEQREAADSPFQQWIAEYLGEGFWRFVNAGSGKVLEISGTDTASGRPLTQASWNDAYGQQWRVVGGPGAETGYYQIANRETGRVVDGLDGTEEAAVQQWPFWGNVPQQFWTFELVSGSEEDEDAGSSVAVDSGLDTDADDSDDSDSQEVHEDSDSQDIADDSDSEDWAGDSEDWAGDGEADEDGSDNDDSDFDDRKNSDNDEGALDDEDATADRGTDCNCTVQGAHGPEHGFICVSLLALVALVRRRRNKTWSG